MSLVNVAVVDDQWMEVQSLLMPIGRKNGFVFSGITSFSVKDILKEVSRTHPTVLLLDVMGEKEEPGTDEAGIRVFKELEANAEWRALQGSVQIVFFSNDPSARRHALIGGARRVDVSGFVAKQHLVDQEPEAMLILTRAAKLASMYSDYPLLADPELRKLSDLTFSPNSYAMHQVWKQIILAGRCHEPVFISGETGSGKELVANAVFKVGQKLYEKVIKGTRGHEELFPLNIAALPSEGNLQYIELFGAQAESATGITKERKGLFEMASEAGKTDGFSGRASGGTVFLDEIGDAAPIVQVALLRVLQEGTINPLGGFNSRANNKKVNFRLITASHSLLANIKNGKFREDLFYRLNGIHIPMPPLRERKGDIGVLTQLFIDKLNLDYGKVGWDSIEIGDPEVLVQKLSSYHWPGNVRELEMSIRSSYVTTIGKTFQLSDQIEQRLTNTTRVVKANVEQILDALRLKPMTIVDIKKTHGQEAAIAVYRALAPNGRRIDENTAKRYFGEETKRGTLLKWVDRIERTLEKSAQRIEAGSSDPSQDDQEDSDG